MDFWQIIMTPFSWLLKVFCQIFDSLSATGITDPAELYRKSIMEYLKEQ